MKITSFMAPSALAVRPTINLLYKSSLPTTLRLHHVTLTFPPFPTPIPWRSRMRYERIIRQRKRATHYKLGKKLALKFRHSQASSLLALLLVPLFVFAIISLLHSIVPLPNEDTVFHSLKPITISQFLEQQVGRRKNRVVPEESISLIAACMNRPESLGLSLPTWEAIEGVDEIVLIDWSSKTHMYEDIPHLSDVTPTARLSLIRVLNADSWALSRAYNLASKFATGKYILKVDCDTHLVPSLLEKMPRPPHGSYYTASWGTERTENEQKLRGVWFGRAADFHHAGGYDERIVGYGYEDRDLYKRFDKFLEAIPLDLDSVKHNTAGDAIFRRESTRSKRISTRMNEAFLSNIASWSDVRAAGNESTYYYSYHSSSNAIYASIKKTPQAVDEENSEDEVQRIKTDVLQKALHDDFSIPWDILPSLEMSDLEYLAMYLDDDHADRVIMTTLEGQDILTNIFNFVSALQLGITTGRPVIAIWTPPVQTSTMLSQVVDIVATNERLKQVVQSEAARRHGFSKPSRLIAAQAWKCQERMSTCAKAYDKAYAHVVEATLQENRVYDEREPLPLSIRDHAFLRLGNSTKLGGREIRALAYHSIVFSETVTRKLSTFASDLGVIAASALNTSSILLEASEVVPDRTSESMVGVIGAGAAFVRQELVGDVDGFCVAESECGVEQICMEVANLVGVVKAERVIPNVDDVSMAKQSWEDGVHPLAEVMIAELRSLDRMQHAASLDAQQAPDANTLLPLSVIETQNRTKLQIV